MLEEIKRPVGCEGVVSLVAEGGAVGGGVHTRVGDVEVQVHIEADPVVAARPLPDMKHV